MASADKVDINNGHSSDQSLSGQCNQLSALAALMNTLIHSADEPPNSTRTITKRTRVLKMYTETEAVQQS